MSSSNQRPLPQPPSRQSVRYWPRGGAAISMVVAVSALVSAVAYSHYAQVRDKAVMREGVERDKERLRILRAQQKRKQKQQQAERQTERESSQ